MKKSEIYRVAQIAILREKFLADETKLEAIHYLAEQEKLEKFIEKRDEKKGAAVENGKL